MVCVEQEIAHDLIIVQRSLNKYPSLCHTAPTCSENRLSICPMTSKSATGYHLQCSGKAADTAAAHQDKNASIQAYFACFCPFVQRAWISLEYIGAALTTEEARAAGIDYQYVEVDPYKKPQELLDISPKGLVP